ncbi:hypothetical protein B0H13DRAFT_1902067 [Mycena leptocephala]|nr:hypothetical protein B0H13DRAFT_1902067 [Mycena leptocephala]
MLTIGAAPIHQSHAPSWWPPTTIRHGANPLHEGSMWRPKSCGINIMHYSQYPAMNVKLDFIELLKAQTTSAQQSHWLICMMSPKCSFLPWGMGEPVGSASWGYVSREKSRGDGVITLALYTGKILGTGVRDSDGPCNDTYLPTYRLGSAKIFVGKMRGAKLWTFKQPSGESEILLRIIDSKGVGANICQGMGHWRILREGVTILASLFPATTQHIVESAGAGKLIYPRCRPDATAVKSDRSLNGLTSAFVQSIEIFPIGICLAETYCALLGAKLQWLHGGRAIWAASSSFSRSSPMPWLASVLLSTRTGARFKRVCNPPTWMSWGASTPMDNSVDIEFPAMAVLEMGLQRAQVWQLQGISSSRKYRTIPIHYQVYVGEFAEWNLYSAEQQHFHCTHPTPRKRKHRRTQTGQPPKTNHISSTNAPLGTAGLPPSTSSALPSTSAPLLAHGSSMSSAPPPTGNLGSSSGSLGSPTSTVVDYTGGTSGSITRPISATSQAASPNPPRRSRERTAAIAGSVVAVVGALFAVVILVMWNRRRRQRIAQRRLRIPDRFVETQAGWPQEKLGEKNNVTDDTGSRGLLHPLRMEPEGLVPAQADATVPLQGDATVPPQGDATVPVQGDATAPRVDAMVPPQTDPPVPPHNQADPEEDHRVFNESPSQMDCVHHADVDADLVKTGKRAVGNGNADGDGVGAYRWRRCAVDAEGEREPSARTLSGSGYSFGFGCALAHRWRWGWR